MADRPMIFSAPMVRGLIREARTPGTGKTKTRRILKPQPWIDQSGNFLAPDRKGKVWNWGQNIDGSPCLRNFIKGQVRFAVGDRLWVRENHAIVPWTAYRASEGVQQIRSPEDPDDAAIYAAGWERSKPRWRPSIHMPRWASRLTLIVTEVRVERLQDISEADAVAEGVEPEAKMLEGRTYFRNYDPTVFGGHLSARASFSTLWSSIHGSEAWNASPWVAVITFRPVLANIDALDVGAAA